MKETSEILEISRSRYLRLSLLLASTPAIVILSALAYAGAVFQKALNVGSNGVPGSGPAVSTNMSVSLTIVIVVVQALVISLALLGFPPKLPKLRSKTTLGGTLAASITSTKSVGKEEWEESQGREESPKANPDVVGDILESLRKKNSATN